LVVFVVMVRGAMLVRTESTMLERPVQSGDVADQTALHATYSSPLDRPPENLTTAS
jgi:hypothetical protein